MINIPVILEILFRSEVLPITVLHTSYASFLKHDMHSLWLLVKIFIAQLASKLAVCLQLFVICLPATKGDLFESLSKRQVTKDRCSGTRRRTLVGRSLSDKAAASGMS